MHSALGLDIGYSNLCVVSGDGGKNKSDLYPAGVAPVGKGTDFDKGKGHDTEVLVNGKGFVALIDQENMSSIPRTLSENYIYGDTYEALYKAILLKSKRGTIGHLVTGLPVTQFADLKTRTDLIKRLEGLHKLTDQAQVMVRKVDVVPQPYGAYLDTLNNPKYTEAFAEADVLVLDPGFFSVDWICVNRYKLQWELSGSSTGATSRILEEAKSLIEAKLGSRLDIERLETALRHGAKSIYVGGEPIDYRPFLAQASDIVAPNVLEEVGSSMRSKTNDVDFVILAGGGASLYEKAAKERFPRSKIITSEDSVMANARGFYYYSLACLEEGDA